MLPGLRFAREMARGPEWKEDPGPGSNHEAEWKFFMWLDLVRRTEEGNGADIELPGASREPGFC
jgi:hypothetical protein